MQFNRSALIGAIDKAMEQEQAAIERVRATNAEGDALHLEEWLSLHADVWQKATATIRAKLRRGLPVTEDDIPRDRTSRGVGKAYFRPRRGEALPTTRTELAGLRAVLDAVSDTEISSAALRSLGVGVNTLRLIVPLLGSASVRSEKAAG
jgi:hypothetical protein